MTKYTKQHILPQFYLKNFGFLNEKDNKNHNLFVGNIKDGTIKEKSIKNIGFKNNIYTNFYYNGEQSKDLEIIFGEYEKKLSNIVKVLINNANNFIKGEHNNLELLNTNSSYIVSLLVFFLKKITLSRLLDNTINITSLDKNVFSENKEAVFDLLYDEGESQLHKIILNKDWNILCLNNNHNSFLTSDFPIFWGGSHTGTQALFEEDTPIFFPITKDIFLVMLGKTCRREESLNYILKEDKEGINEMNKASLTNAKNFIFGYSKYQVEEGMKLVYQGKIYTPNKV